MYIANRRDSSKFNGCSPLQLHLGLKGMEHAITYLPYTQRCDTKSLYIIVLQGNGLDKTYCSSNSILPGQRMYGVAP